MSAVLCFRGRKMFSHNETLLESLYCEEESWDDGEVIQSHGIVAEEEGDIGEVSFSAILEVNFWEDEELGALLKKEEEIEVFDGFEGADLRAEAVEWMLGVVGFYSFSAQTAVLAANYFDRFIQGFKIHREKPWITQLAAVACLSLAAKIEETHVPLLLDLQVEEAKFVFEAKTIQRMEILVLSTLEWKMNSVTPLSFLHCIARKLGFDFKGYFLRNCEPLLLSAVSDYRFTSFLPSTLASATMLHVLRSLEPSIAVHRYTQLIGILRISEDKVEDCCKLIQEAAMKLKFNPQSRSKRKHGVISESPTGVVDVCFSSDNEFRPIGSNPASVSSSPALKKNKPSE